MSSLALLIALVLAGWLAIGVAIAYLVRDPSGPPWQRPLPPERETFEQRIQREAADAVRMPAWFSPVAALVFVAAIAASAVYPWGWF